MPIQYEDSTATRKSIDVAVVPSSTGVTVSGAVRFFDDLYQIPATVVPCVYSDDAAYRVALCKHASGPAIVLVEDDAVPAGYEQIVYLARWAFTSNADTCASVVVHVPRKTLTGDAPQSPTVHAVSSTPVLPVQTPEKTRGRKRQRRIRQLTRDARALRDAGTTYSAMTAGQRQTINELCALLLDVPLEIP